MGKSKTNKNTFEPNKCDVKGCNEIGFFEKRAGKHLCKKHFRKFLKWFAASLGFVLIIYFFFNLFN